MFVFHINFSPFSLFLILLLNNFSCHLNLNLLLQNSVFLPVDKELLYRYHFFETHDKYPTDKLVYMGNKVDIEFPIDEHIPKNSLYYLYTHWENFVHTVCFRFGVWKKYGEGHEKFKI